MASKEIRIVESNDDENKSDEVFFKHKAKGDTTIETKQIKSKIKSKSQDEKDLEIFELAMDAEESDTEEE